MRRRDLLLAAPACALAGGSPSPTGLRRSHFLAYDTARRELLLCGGVQPVDPSGFEPLWAYRRGRWREKPLQGPRTRMLMSGAFDRVRNVLVAYGGAGPA